jgi:hypothetical protein
MKLYSALTKDYANSSFKRKPELYHLLANLRPRQEPNNGSLSRLLDFRTALEAAKCQDDEFISAFFLVGMCDTDHFKDWSLQQFQPQKPAVLPARSISSNDLSSTPG